MRARPRARHKSWEICPTIDVIDYNVAFEGLVSVAELISG